MEVNASPSKGSPRGSQCTRVIRSQPHVDFMNTVRALPLDKIAAIWEMGFGPQSIGCPQLYDQVWKSMVDGFEPLNEKVVIGGKAYDIHASDFDRLLGVRDGGFDVDFSGDSNTMLLARKVQQELAGLDGKITLSSLKEIVLRRESVDQIFRVAYVLYAISAILCPTNSELVDSILLVPMLKIKAIGDLNWATYCFSKLLDGALTRSRNDYAISGACLLFLQVFYFDAVGTSLGWVDKTITPVIFWGVDKAANLVQVISDNGGFTSENDRVWAKDAEKHEGMKVVETMFEQVKEALSQFVSVKDAVHSLREIVGTVQVDHAQMAESLSGVRIEIKDIVAAVVAEVLKRLTPELDAMHGARTVGTKRAGTEKSNSAHFNGEKKIESKGGNSEDSSCMFLYSNKVNGQRIQNDQIKVNANAGKASQPTLSDCSVSPSPAEKNRPPVAGRQLFKKSGIPRRKKSPMKGLGRNNGTVARPLRVIPGISKEDKDLLKFIFMHMEKTDLDCSLVVASNQDGYVTRTALQCLGPRQRVAGEVIDLFVGYLNEIGKEDWYVPTFFARSCIRKADHFSDDDWIRQCRKLSRLDRFIDHFANCRRIFIPMHEPLPTNELDGHWLLLLVHVPDRSVEILDSAPDPSKTISRQRDARAVLNMLDRIYGDSKFRQANKLFAFGTLPFKANGTGPRQKNDFDCGVYVIRNMQKYGTDWAAKYNSEIERASLVVECLRHPKNEVVDLHVRVDRCLARNTGK